MRDEAHRFSRKLHHKEETKRVFNKKVPRKKKDLSLGKEKIKIEIQLDKGPLLEEDE